MLRRTLLAFLAFLFLVLLLIVGYAFSGLSGPETTIADADEAFAAGRYTRCIELADLAEQGLGGSRRPELRARLLELRFRANLALGNYKPALRDLDTLITEHRPEDSDLHKERVRLLIAAKMPERALQSARTALEETPDDWELLELAGQAAQAVYQRDLTALLGELRTRLAPRTHREAARALRLYLYTSAKDPRPELAKRRFDGILKRFLREAYVTRAYDARLAVIREHIAQAQRYYRESLVRDGTPVAAYRGLAFALGQAQRHDDVVCLAETYLRRFRHVYATEAAGDIAQAHLAAGRPHAAAEIAERFLADWRTKLEQNQLDRSLRRLMLRAGQALHALKDDARLAKLAAIESQLFEAGLPLDPEGQLVHAFHRDLQGDYRAVEQFTSTFTGNPRIRALPSGDEDLYVQATRLRLRALERIGAAPPAMLEVYADWIAQRPGSPEPFLERARFFTKLGKGEEALVDATTGLDLAGHDEEALRVYAAAADLAFAASGRDSESLLAQCRSLGVPRPQDVADDVLYLTTAQLALERNEPRIALETARRGSQLFVWARWPRYVMARAAMRLGAYDQAVAAMQTLRDYHPEDLEGLRLLREARRRAGLSNDHLLFDVALSGEPDSDLARTLLRGALRRNEIDAALRLSVLAPTHFGRDPEVMLLVARTTWLAGRFDAARAVLSSMFEAFYRENPRAAARAAAESLRLEAELGNEGVARFLARLVAVLMKDQGPELLQLAREMDRLHRYEPAYLLLQPVLADERHAALRNGAVYLLAGRMALHVGRPEEARAHLTAALTFEDGQPAARLLALVLLARGELAAAKDALGTRNEPVDLAEAALLARLGAAERAAAWAAEQLSRRSWDLPAQALLAATAPDDEVAADARELARGARETLLDLLAFSGAPELAREAVRRARELVEKAPSNRLARWLRARALAAAQRFDEAIAELEKLVDEDPADLAALDELVRLLEVRSSSKLTDPVLGLRASRAVERHPERATPRLIALARRHTVSELQTHGHFAFALTILGRLLAEYPKEAGATPEEVRLLLMAGRHDLAFRLLLALEKIWPAKDFDAYLDVFAAHARAILEGTQRKDLRRRVEAKVRAHLRRHGAHGALVHLVLDRPSILGDSLDERALLEEHIGLFRQGKDRNVPLLIATLARLARVDGETAVLRRVEEMLHEDPSLVALWIQRAHLLERAGRADDAARGLRWLFTYTTDPEVVIEHARIRGETGNAGAEDEQRLRRLEETWRDRPQTRFALGLAVLRQARYAEAARILERALDRPDGARYYFAAMAHLCSRTRGSGTRARALFGELAERFPASRWAELAGDLARQLDHVARTQAAAR